MEAETKTLPLENASILSEGSLQEGHRLWIGNLDPKITEWVWVILNHYLPHWDVCTDNVQKNFQEIQDIFWPFCVCFNYLWRVCAFVINLLCSHFFHIWTLLQEHRLGNGLKHRPLFFCWPKMFSRFHHFESLYPVTVAHYFLESAHGILFLLKMKEQVGEVSVPSQTGRGYHSIVIHVKHPWNHRRSELEGILKITSVPLVFIQSLNDTSTCCVPSAHLCQVPC